MSSWQSWLGRAHFLLEGVIHTYIEGETEHEAWVKAKQVPQSRVVAVFDGSWKHHIKWRKTGSTNSSAATSASDVTSTAETETEIGEYATLLDLSTLKVIPKAVRPIEKQLSNESRKLWHDVTTRLIKKEYGEATKYKLAIEQKQRDEAAERKRQGVE
jgi:oxysterol-binding protein-related protein 9/10/11